jgi:hypothetical protein
MSTGQTSDFLLLSRGQWDKSSSKADIEAAIGKFYAWYEAQIEKGRFKPGSRLTMDAALVTREGVSTDLPPAVESPENSLQGGKGSRFLAAAGTPGNGPPRLLLTYYENNTTIGKNRARRVAGLTAVWLVWAGMGMAGAQDAPGGLKVPDGVIFEKGITYGTAAGQALLLDLAKPKEGAGPFPALVLVHGGGWAAGDRSAYHAPMLAWAKLGIVCVSVDYRLAPQFKFPCQIEDVKCAVRWMRANAGKYHVDGDRIGALGGSAGAHLVALLGTTSGSGK